MESMLFETLFRNLQPRLFAYCCKYVDDKEMARDLVQECFINFWENQDSVTLSPEAYLFTSVRNRCLSYIRSQKVRSDYHESVRLQIREFEFHPDTPDPVLELYMKEVKDLLNVALNSLPPRSRQIFIMSRFQGLKNTEIANQLNISVRTVESQLYQALKHIKKHLKDYFPLIGLLFNLQ
ncbi:RNA polymerase sigma-70 factor [Bacteroides intestinalis]|uniref:RNA polymerase sigma-70 factor n=2 Tax=Bacteroides intestinalis TaxID=329854 RepID=A0A414L3M4_9BACE|nr:RNA polymerase sigma-70 factor [Bacteroides intestinalis]